MLSMNRIQKHHKLQFDQSAYISRGELEIEIGKGRFTLKLQTDGTAMLCFMFI